MSIDSDLPGMDFARNPSERLPCVLVVDTSGSMEKNNAINDLNEGLRTFADGINNHAKARQSVRLKLIRCGETVETLVDWTDASSFDPPLLQAEGGTPLGEAVNFALDEIEAEKRRLDEAKISRKRAWLFIFTDGDPTDEWQSAAARCRQLEQSKSLSCYGIAVNGAKVENLAQFSEKNPVARLNSEKFISFFKVLTEQMKVSSGAAKGETTKNPQMSWEFVG